MIAQCAGRQSAASLCCCRHEIGGGHHAVMRLIDPPTFTSSAVCQTVGLGQARAISRRSSKCWFKTMLTNDPRIMEEIVPYVGLKIHFGLEGRGHGRSPCSGKKITTRSHDQNKTSKTRDTGLSKIWTFIYLKKKMQGSHCQLYQLRPVPSKGSHILSIPRN